MLIDKGCKSSMADAEVGCWVGCGASVGAGVGVGVKVGVGACVGMTVGDGARVGMGVTVVVCPAATDPQEASVIMSITMQGTITILVLLIIC